MDLLTLVLIEIAVVEFLVIAILLVLLLRKPLQQTGKKSKRFSVQEVEREADAIASVGRKVNR